MHLAVDSGEHRKEREKRGKMRINIAEGRRNEERDHDQNVMHALEANSQILSPHAHFDGVLA